MSPLPASGGRLFRSAHRLFVPERVKDGQEVSPSEGGLQVWSSAGDWEDAPYHPDAFTINTGDLLARWSGDRWKSNRHRVHPPQADAPDEDLVSLVFFHEADSDTVVHACNRRSASPTATRR